MPTTGSGLDVQRGSVVDAFSQKDSWLSLFWNFSSWCDSAPGSCWWTQLVPTWCPMPIDVHGLKIQSSSFLANVVEHANNWFWLGCPTPFRSWCLRPEGLCWSSLFLELFILMWLSTRFLSMQTTGSELMSNAHRCTRVENPKGG